MAKYSCKCFLRLSPVFILRAETLSDPLWIKKRTILIVTGMKTSVLTQFGIGSCCSEKGEVLLFWVPRQEAGGDAQGEVSSSGTEQGTSQDPLWLRGCCHSHYDMCSLITSERMSHCAACSGSFSVMVMVRFGWTWYKPTVFLGFFLSALNFQVLLENVLILKRHMVQKEVNYWVPNRENCGWRRSKWVRYK